MKRERPTNNKRTREEKRETVNVRPTCFGVGVSAQVPLMWSVPGQVVQATVLRVHGLSMCTGSTTDTHREEEGCQGQ
jgi:hypothetical protein